MWTYEQVTGWMYDDAGMKLAQGYSGNGEGLNSPSLQEVKDVGPIPQGHYTIGPMEAEHATLGPDVLPLTPDPDNSMYGRGAFYIHGDNFELNHTASEGCIILPRFARDRINESLDRRLLVVATTTPTQTA